MIKKVQGWHRIGAEAWRGRREERRARRLGVRTYWVRQRRRAQWRASRASLSVWVRTKSRQSRQDGGIVIRWVGQAAYGVVTAWLLLAASEGVAALVRRHHLLALGLGLDQRLSAEFYEGFVAATVGSLAAFLALFFTTMGVVATTAYSEVPGEVRDLFVRERGNALYINAVMRAVVFGLAVLGMRAVGYHPYSLTIIVFWVLAGFAVLGLVALGTGLFNFFDLASLAAPLPRRFDEALAYAAVSRRGAPPAEHQQLAQDSAARVLREYRLVYAVLAARRGGDSRSTGRLLAATLAVWSRYAGVKSAIPTSSCWFPGAVQHPNWLTLNPWDLQIPLATRRPARASLSPDLLWVERELAQDVVTLLELVLAAGDGSLALLGARGAAELVFRLAGDLQVEEATLLSAKSTAAIDRAVDLDRAQDPRDSESPIAWDAEDRRRFRVEAIEFGTMARIHLWLGLAEAAKSVCSADLPERLEHAAAHPNDPSAVKHLPVPRELREVLDEISHGLLIEERSQGHRVTPEWWIHHYTARALARSLRATANSFLDDMEAYLPARLTAVAAQTEPELHTALIFASLHLVQHAKEHVATVTRALTALDELRHPATGDQQWPQRPIDIPRITVMEESLLRDLAATMPHLSNRPHTGDEADLFGQAYHYVTDALHDAIIEQRDDLARELFPTAFAAVDRARERLATDLADRPPFHHLAHGTAPLVDLMQVSGYALFLHELDGSGIWPLARDAWDPPTHSPELATNLSMILAQRHRQIGVDMRRTSWEQRFEAFLANRGLSSRRRGSFLGQPTGPPHRNPVVAAVLDQSFNSTYLMADLFLVEYLTARPGATDVPLDRNSQRLRDAIRSARQAEPTHTTDAQADEEGA